MTFVDIDLRRVDEKTQKDLLQDLQAVCEATERRAFGLVYSCKTDKLGKITKILNQYEKQGLEISHDMIDGKDDPDKHIFVLRPWLGFRRILSTGQIQIMRNGRILTYASKRDLLADTPLREKETFAHWEATKA
jgi:hypothetical protein